MYWGMFLSFLYYCYLFTTINTTINIIIIIIIIIIVCNWVCVCAMFICLVKKKM